MTKKQQLQIITFCLTENILVVEHYKWYRVKVKSVAFWPHSPVWYKHSFGKNK